MDEQSCARSPPACCCLARSWASGKTLMEGLVQAYGNLYKVPGKSS